MQTNVVLTVDNNSKQGRPSGDIISLKFDHNQSWFPISSLTITLPQSSILIMLVINQEKN
jgi:hypothetical protein